MSFCISNPGKVKSDLLDRSQRTRVAGAQVPYEGGHRAFKNLARARMTDERVAC